MRRGELPLVRYYSNISFRNETEYWRRRNESIKVRGMICAAGNRTPPSRTARAQKRISRGLDTRASQGEDDILSAGFSSPGDNKRHTPDGACLLLVTHRGIRTAFCAQREQKSVLPSCAKQANPADLWGSIRFKISNKQRDLP